MKIAKCLGRLFTTAKISDGRKVEKKKEKKTIITSRGYFDENNGTCQHDAFETHAITVTVDFQNYKLNPKSD